MENNENYMICNCKQVSYADIAKALHNHTKMEDAIKVGADVYITGDVSHHAGIDAVARNLMVIDAGHYGIEHIFIELVQKYLCEKCLEVDVIPMPIDNPQKYL